MTTLPQAILDTGRTYSETLVALDQHNAVAKEMKKKVAKCKREIKKYMAQQQLQTLKVGDTTFSFEQREKLVLTIDRVEKAFPPSAVEKYKRENAEVKTIFSCS